MTFNKYWSSLDNKGKKHLAKKAKTTYNYLSQVANGHRRAGADVIEGLMRADKIITFVMMRK